MLINKHPSAVVPLYPLDPHAILVDILNAEGRNVNGYTRWSGMLGSTGMVAPVSG